ncbi:lincosamide nucleotidyltransferase A/C/D/E [Lentzea fradiae]|uniref:Lincosamide nucleotidyltransferase A/C/D/E n=1 Tax=Lentzea fradiae TaxID=200378 RepID=A0A1G7P337_9PSEU|nr:amino acid transporter [Lentzea fradiae]SDF80732.1 lincosamide nucleotidyltransferase A/C/D/E [Lentzea fradiae]
MTAEDVLEILAALEGTDVWIGGGWGVDALAGRQTRPHDDLDLLHREDREPRVLSALAGLKFAETLSWRPVRFVLTDPAGREIDLHPLRFAADGSAEQSSLTPGEPFRYPASCFVTGTIGGVEVPCLSVEQQLHFHQGYQPRERDLHDVALLRALRPKTGWHAG